MNSSSAVHASAQKITETAKSLKICCFVFILKFYVDKLKWYINSKWAAWAMQLLNVLLANGVNVYRLRLCCRRTFWAHAEMKMMWSDICDFLSDNDC